MYKYIHGAKKNKYLIFFLLNYFIFGAKPYQSRLIDLFFSIEKFSFERKKIIFLQSIC